VSAVAGARLDDLPALGAVDRSGMLRDVATSAAQLRTSVALAGEAGLDALAADVRPRAVVVAGMGGSAVAGDVLAALAGPRAPLPVYVHRGYGLPAWVGPADLVCALSCSGGTEETLSAAEEAMRRGSRLTGVGAPDSPLAQLVAVGHGPFVAVDPAGRQPRASLWSLAGPLLSLADRLELLPLPEAVTEATAVRLEQIAESCRPDQETWLNPAKELAVALAGTLPVVWGSSPLAGVAAGRFAAQLAENAKYPSLSGVLPEANHNQVVTFEGRAPALPGLSLVLLRDTDEHPQVARRAAASAELAEARGIPVRVVTAEGDSPLERFAALVGVTDFASVYLAVLLGVDPTPIAPITDLKARIARPAG
jgi:glucose/mannose-6-phosphate isomerase